MQNPIETSPELTTLPDADTAAPSADFIQTISHFFDTDPSDLLREMGYYSRQEESRSRE